VVRFQECDQLLLKSHSSVVLLLISDVLTHTLNPARTPFIFTGPRVPLRSTLGFILSPAWRARSLLSALIPGFRCEAEKKLGV